MNRIDGEERCSVSEHMMETEFIYSFWKSGRFFLEKEV